MTVITRDHQVEIGSSLVVCSRTEPVRRGSVENRDRRGRYGGRYARAARRFAGGRKRPISGFCWWQYSKSPHRKVVFSPFLFDSPSGGCLKRVWRNFYA